MPKAVLTPDGRFASARLAAAHHNLTYNTVHRWIREGRHGWRYAELPPLPVITLASKPTRKLGPRRPKLSTRIVHAADRRNGASYQDIPAALCHGLLGIPGTGRLTLREAVLLHIVLTAPEELMAVDIEGIFATKASTSRSVTRLENLGLIRRIASGQGYGKFLVPTRRARALLRAPSLAGAGAAQDPLRLEARPRGRLKAALCRESLQLGARDRW